MKPQNKRQESRGSVKKRKRINVSRILFIVVIGMITIGLVGSSFMALL